MRKAKLRGFTHITKRTRQLCFHACWWPSANPSLGPKEKERPLMMFKSGQCQRVNINNIELIGT